MTTKATSLADMLKQAELPLAAGAVERAEVGCLGLPDTVRVHEEDFAAIVQLLAHRESQGFTWLGFNDGDAVEFDRYDEVDQPEDTEDPNDFHIAFTSHHPYWDLVLSISAASTAEGSPFMVDFTAPIRANAEFVIDEKAKRLMFARATDNELR
ncbi:MAG: hypothetical protein ACKO9H_00280, partial [Planctomycetota bacterium]